MEVCPIEYFEEGDVGMSNQILQNRRSYLPLSPLVWRGPKVMSVGEEDIMRVLHHPGLYSVESFTLDVTLGKLLLD